jgi:hypothetical protein
VSCLLACVSFCCCYLSFQDLSLSDLCAGLSSWAGRLGKSARWNFETKQQYPPSPPFELLIIPFWHTFLCLVLFIVDYAFYLFVLAVVHTFSVHIYHGSREIGRWC